jgi:vancomycin permeability regulator SanA
MKRACIFGEVAFSLLIVLILVVNVGIHLSSKPYIYNDFTKAPDAEVALIPGAAILADGEPSPIFLDRVNMAINLYEAGKVSKIRLSSLATLGNRRGGRKSSP